MRQNEFQKIQNEIGRYSNSHKRKKRWLTAVTCLAALVVFCTVYALILPAVTMTDSTLPAKLNGTTQGISYSVTPAASGGYRLVLDAGSSKAIPSDLLSDEKFSGYRDELSIVEIGAQITEIEANAFSSASQLRSVEFETGGALEKIGAGAFSGCQNLSSANLEVCGNLKAVGKTGDGAETGAFYNTALKQITIPAGVTDIADFTFYGCDKLTDVKFEKNTVLTNMGAYVFAECTALESVSLENVESDNLKFNTKDSMTIGTETAENGSGLFYGCTSLKSLTLPNMEGSVAYLCKGCSSLASISLDSCAKLVCDDSTGNSQFRKFIDGCTSLEELDLSGATGMTVFYQGIVGGNDGGLVNSSVKKVILPPSVTRIAQTAFGWSSVETVLFTKNADGNSSLKSVGGTDFNIEAHTQAFASAEHLKELDLQFDSTAQQSELYLLTSAFLNCASLEKLTISSPAGLNTLGEGCFADCKNLQDLTWDVKKVNTVCAWGWSVGALSKNIRFTVGPNTEVLPSYLINSMKDNISEYIFTPNHSFYIDSAVGGPFTEAGCYYADANGSLYRLKSDGTAQLVYAERSTRGEFTVPEVLNAKYCTADGRSAEESSFTVTGVCSGAFTGAVCSAITFENPDNIIEINDNAFSGAFRLERINNKNTEDEIKALFKNVDAFGSDLFVGTKITSRPFTDPAAEAVTPGSKAIAVTSDNLVQLSVASDSKLQALREEKRLATGETANITLGVSNNSSGEKTRLYIKLSDSSSFTLSDFLGTSALKKSNVSDVYYYDIPDTDDTTAYSLGIKCSEFVAPNKKAYLWLAEASDSEALTAIGNEVIEPGGGTGAVKTSLKYIEVTWDVLAKAYSVTKTANEDLTPVIRNTDSAVGSGTVSNLGFIVYNSTAKRSNADSGDTNSYDSFGADYVDYVEYEDILTLPEGLSWREGLLNSTFKTNIAANKKSGSVTAEVGGKTYTVCTLNLASDSLKELGCSVQNGELKITWTTENKTKTTEITAAETTVTYGNDVIIADSAYDTEASGSVTNTVAASPYYTYSGPGEQKTVKASVSLASSSLKLTVSKDWVKKPAKMGEEAIYKVTANHIAEANKNAAVDIYDDFGTCQYLKTKTIEQMLTALEYDGDYLTVEIQNAVLLPVPEAKTVTAVDGKATSGISVNNTAANPVYNDLAKEYAPKASGVTITVKKAGTGSSPYITVSTNESSDGEALEVGTGKPYESLQAALDALGYVVSANDSYILHWSFPANTVKATDTHKEYELHAYVKNSLQILTQDLNTSIVADVADTSHTYEVSNKLYASKEDYINKSHAIQTKPVGVLYDLSIDKVAVVDGEEKDTDALALLLEQGKDFVIDYQTVIRHYGSGAYGLMPVVDRMTGVQALLAGVEDNKGEDGSPPSWAANADKITVDGSEYYILNAKDASDGTAVYNGVWLQNGYADSVTVTKKEDGFDTLIKWYYIDDSNSDYTLGPSYKALYSLTYTEFEKIGSYHFVYNEIWVNDIPTKRLHDNIGARGASVTFHKQIVTYKGETANADKLWDSSQPYAIDGEGAKITYRLDFENTGSLETALGGNDFYDVLPDVALGSDGSPVFAWSDENVKISYKTSRDEITISDTSINGYSITSDENGKYQIKWDGNFSILFPEGINGAAYIYVELTFPTGDAWTQYVVSKGNSLLYNTLYVRGVASQVSHTLPNPGEAMLRKGVYETGYYVLDNTGYTYQYFRGADRNHYVKTAENAKTVKNTVTYFVTLYNSSDTANLYLSSIYDKLPEGFEFYAMVTTSDMTDPTVGYSGSVGLWNKWSGRTADSVGLTAWSYAPLARPEKAETLLQWSGGTDNTVKVQTPYDGQLLTFDITLDAQHKDSLGYYLRPGEALQFGYMCFTGDADVTSAVNLCAMEYLDYSHSGISLTEEENQAVAVTNTVISAPENTGSARLITNERAAELGFTQTNQNNPVSERRWLASGVSLTESNIIPGITKTVDTYNVKKDSPAEWTVAVTNSGGNAMRDYTITDTIQNPFNFTGEVGYTLLSSSPNADSVEVSERGRNEVVIAGTGDNDYLFVILDVTDKGVSVKSNKGGDTVTILYGEAKKITVSTRFLQSVSAGGSYSDAEIKIGFTKDSATGDVSMSVSFGDPEWSIPADGEGILKINTLIPGNTAGADGVYVNNAVVTPYQAFDANSVTRGTVSDDSKSISSATSVNIYSGILTIAYKEVTSGDKYGVSANYEGKGDNPDKILVSSKDAGITYTLNVTGASGNNMQKLVVIDSLPQTGDTNPINDKLQRGSQYKINFSDNPNVTAVIVTKDSAGNITNTRVLSQSEYTVQYSSCVKGFGKATDWEYGKEDSGKWHNTFDADTDRSIRVVINQPLTENETVRISYNAVIDKTEGSEDAALPGETAWSNFGYSFLTDAQMWLYSSPQKVGVTLQGAPSVTKALINADGTAVGASATGSFNFDFVIYKGTAEDAAFGGYDAVSVGNALEGKDFTYFTLTVNSGEASSAKRLLDPLSVSNPLKKYACTNGVFTQTADNWLWENGEKYTIVELDGAADSEYTYSYTDSAENTVRAYTFTYDQSRNQAFTVYNERHNWSVVITKTDNKNNPKKLSGAVFGLYSVTENPDIADLFAQFGLSADTPTQFTQNGVTYYLSQLAVTGTDGTAEWQGLSEDIYIVRELKPPDGYIGSTDAIKLTYEEARNNGWLLNRSVINTAGYELPETGSIGTVWFTAGGLLLIMTAGVGVYKYRRIRLSERRNR